ncbi:MAG TPA: hypothetical protein VEF76_02460 [Patescibacteria group bacterium]|nr:hypothetical protein [Patescibacteria group bacterium]
MAQEKQSKAARHGDTASRVAIAGAAEAEIRNIKGYNFFAGDFTPSAATSIGTAVCTQEEWDALWRGLDRTPPGPLPKDTRAVFEARAEQKPRVTSYEPSSIVMNAHDEIWINWNKILVGKDEDPTAKGRYAVLLLPEKGTLKSKFNEVWPIREKREKMKKFDESLNLFRKGRNEILPAPGGANFSHYRARRNTGKPSRNN